MEEKPIVYMCVGVGVQLLFVLSTFGERGFGCDDRCEPKSIVCVIVFDLSSLWMRN